MNIKTLTNLPETGYGSGSIVTTFSPLPSFASFSPEAKKEEAKKDVKKDIIIKHEEGFFINFVLVKGKRFNYNKKGIIKCIETGSFKDNFLYEGSVLYKTGTLEIGVFHKNFLIKGEVIGLSKKNVDNSPFTKYL